MNRKLANVSVDLDGLNCYHAIHSLKEPADPTAIYTVAMPRFLDLFAEYGVRATFFVIAADLQYDATVRSLRLALDAGHEVASHSYHHPYNLRSLSIGGIGDELDLASDTIHERLGIRPVGFRTPGYNVDTKIVRLLAERGYLYDSSVFPCPPYYLAKAGVMAWMALTGKPSGSSMTDPSSLRAPIQPYRPSRFDFSKAGDRKHSLPIWEIPMGLVPGVRFPVIGTSVGAMGPTAVRALYKAFRIGQQTLQFEMHGIDLMDHTDEAVHPKLVRKQPDVRRSWAAKRAAFGTLYASMARDYTFVTLEQLATHLEQAAGPTVIGA